DQAGAMSDRRADQRDPGEDDERDREHEHVIVAASNDTPAVATSRRRRRARAISSSCTRRWWHPGTVRWMREPFSRMDPEDDAVFYSLARKVVHLEPGAIEALRGVYAGRFPPGATVLDLISSWRAPPPAARGPPGRPRVAPQGG